MRKFKSIAAACAAVFITQLAHAEFFKIAGFTFDEANTIRTASIVEGPLTVVDRSNSKFGRFSEEYATNINGHINEFRNFDRSRSVGRLLGRQSANDYARHIGLAEPGDTAPMQNVHRTTVELTWGGAAGLPNKPGADFVIFESGLPEAYVVSVRKAGSSEFSHPRYQFVDSVDKLHNANATAFDISKFGLGENDVITAIRIRSVFSSLARNGGDRVDDASGQGTILYPGDPQYKGGSPILNKAGGREFKPDELGADIVYVAGLHNLVPIKDGAAQTASADAAKSDEKK